MKQLRQYIRRVGLLLYSGATDTISVFSRVMTDEPAAMTYDEAVEWLPGQE